MKSPFKSKIKCAHCSGNFKKKKERGKLKYCCTNYDIGRCTKRIILEHDFLMSVINKRYLLRWERELSEQEVGEQLEYAIIEDKMIFRIKLKSFPDEIIYSHNHINF